MMVSMTVMMIHFLHFFLISAMTLKDLELLNDNLFLVDPEAGMLEVDLEQLEVHVLETLDHDVLDMRIVTF